MLSIVSTPIGNLEDITLRALRTLKEADIIACEDTRHTGILLKHFDIQTRMVSFHSHSGQGKLDGILEMLKQGKHVALVSDAGTPGISDPGYRLISKAVELGIKVVPIPGASAVLSALVGSGLPMDEFVYLGFLPIKKGRQTLLKQLQDEERTIVIYESPRRIVRTLQDIQKSLGDDVRIVVARELTKLHEEFVRGSIVEVIADFAKRPLIKGELTILVKRH